MASPQELPYLTAHLPGTGGSIKSHARHFEVEEIPLYEPCGAGTHTYLWIEKEGLTTFEAIRSIARALGKRDRDIGHAGLKDSVARTRQWFSVEHVADLAPLANRLPPSLKVLQVSHHKNKLRLGHLRGNRFKIRVRGVGADALVRARAILSELERVGMPAFFGEQRFGVHASTHELGRALVRRDPALWFETLLAPSAPEALALARDGQFDQAIDAVPHGRLHRYERDALVTLKRARGDFERAVPMLDRRMLRFYVAAYQSHLFNRVLTARLATCRTLIEGDIAYLHRNGACFQVADLAAEQPRAAAFEISPSGPLFGPEMLQPQAAALSFEHSVLADEGVTADQFGADPVRLPGARRPLRSPLTDIAVAMVDGDAGEDDSVGAGQRGAVPPPERRDLCVQFALPPGMYASVALREITKAGALSDLPEVDSAGDVS